MKRICNLLVVISVIFSLMGCNSSNNETTATASDFYIGMSDEEFFDVVNKKRVDIIATVPIIFEAQNQKYSTVHVIWCKDDNGVAVTVESFPSDKGDGENNSVISKVTDIRTGYKKGRNVSEKVESIVVGETTAYQVLELLGMPVGQFTSGLASWTYVEEGIRYTVYFGLPGGFVSSIKVSE